MVSLLLISKSSCKVTLPYTVPSLPFQTMPPVPSEPLAAGFNSGGEPVPSFIVVMFEALTIALPLTCRLATAVASSIFEKK